MQKIIIANWKMYLSREQSLEFLQKFKILNSKFQIPTIIICPSFTVLSDLKSLIHDFKFLIHLGAQDCFWEERGAFTGEASPADLKNLGCEYVIIGHSERRRYLKETDKMINLKIKAALKAGLTPIFCVGETAIERQKGRATSRVHFQIQKGLAGVFLSKNQRLIVAYEPVWAISTGKFCPPEEAVKMHCLIKKETSRRFSAKQISVIYGGSVDDKNAAEYLRHAEIDGVLVGGASAKLDVFTSLLNHLNLKS